MKILNELWKRYPDSKGISIAVETGTYQTKTTRALKEAFRRVFTIELGWEFFHNAQQSLGPDTCCLWGDSAKVLPALLRDARLDEPVLFYLDAHWFDKPLVPTDSPMPLVEEIEAIAQRPYADVIVIDDCQYLGQGWKSTNTPTERIVDHGWRKASVEWINKTLGRVRDTFTVTDNTQHMIFVQEAAS